MSDNFIKTMFYIFVALLTIYPLFELFKKNQKLIKRILIGLAIVIFIWIALLAKGVDDRDKKSSDSKIDSLEKHESDINDNVRKLTDKAEKESTNNKIFLDTLLHNFGIKRDSLSNKPVQNNITTNNVNIGKADKVHIGPNYH